MVAAGNYGRSDYANTYGYATITSPANSPFVITVGAMKNSGTSFRGDDVIASGMIHKYRYIYSVFVQRYGRG